jgi:tetratricopeptide (TPR) repeat protein
VVSFCCCLVIAWLLACQRVFILYLLYPLFRNVQFVFLTSEHVCVCVCVCTYRYQDAIGRYELALDVHEALHEELNQTIDKLTAAYDAMEEGEEHPVVVMVKKKNSIREGGGGGGGEESVDIEEATASEKALIETQQETDELKHNIVNRLNELMEERREGLIDRAKVLNNLAAVMQQVEKYEEAYQT